MEKGIGSKTRRFIKRASLMTGMLLMCMQFTRGQVKIVPLGNSITQGDTRTQGANSYRRNLWNKLNDAGYQVDFVGSHSTANGGRTFPDASFDPDHEGHWGWRADEILAELAGWLTGYTPDVALIHLGSNDAIQANSVGSTLDEIEDIIGVLRNDNARITIFLAQILPLEDATRNANVNGINSGLVNLSSNLDEAQSRIILVDQNSGWNISDHTYDGVHPNLAGEERMAQRWFTAFDAFYSTQNEAPEITGQAMLSVNEDFPITLSVSDFTISDPDTDPADMSLSVYGGSYYSVNGTTITPEENWHGTLRIQVTVNDGESESEPYIAQVTVNSVNDPPTISGQGELAVDEDEQLTLLLSDFTISDPDSDPGDRSLNVSGGSHYSVNGTTVSPDENWHGTLSIQVTVNDGISEGEPFDATVTVHPVNDAPVIADIPDQTIVRGEQFDLIDLGMYVEDDETPDMQINWSVLGASRLSVTITDQWAVILPLDGDWTGSETIYFIAADDDPGGSLSSVEEVQFTIQTPVAVAGSEAAGFGIYPNPSDGEFYIDTYGEPADLVLVLSDARGRILKHRTYQKTSRIRENLHAYPSGIYQIKIIRGTQIQHLKYLKY